MQRILGIDPGSRTTGFAIIESDKSVTRYVHCGCIRLGSGDIAERIANLYQCLTQVIEQYRPHAMAVEQVFMSKNASSALKLGHARGVILLAGMQHMLEISEYSAKQVKRSVVGTGSASKEQVQHMVKRLLNLPAWPQEDAADALAIAICHAHFSAHSISQQIRKTEQDVVHSRGRLKSIPKPV